MPVIRSFIAIELSPEIQAGLSEIAGQLKSHLKGLPLRWVPVKNIHLTLKFLGDVSVDHLNDLERVLDSGVRNSRIFDITIGQLGVFPSLQRPRVIWVGVQAPEALYDLQAGVERETRHLGYTDEKRRYHPHLTIARVSKNASSSEIHRIGNILTNQKVGSIGTTYIQAVHLYKSDLLPGGAVYTRLYTAQLPDS